MSAEPWYAAKCIFRHSGLQPERKSSVYEERVLLIRASDFREAQAKAEAEARRYAASGIEYLGFIDIYHLPAETIGDGVEVYSLMRASKLQPTEYLNRFHDTGAEHSKKEDSAT
jgi:hypothetical protein